MSSAVADMPPERLYERIRQRPPRNCENNASQTLDALDESSIWYGKHRMAGRRSHGDQLGRLGTIHQRDRQTHTDSHVAVAIAALTHGVRAAETTTFGTFLSAYEAWE